MNREPESLVISSQVVSRGETGDIDDVLKENPVIITFLFQVGNTCYIISFRYTCCVSITMFTFQASSSDVSMKSTKCVFWNFEISTNMWVQYF